MYQDTKTKIMSAAEELITENGVEATTISMIAKKAGVADSLAYQYFKDKDDLIVAVFHERMKGTLELLQEHLEGIIDARSRLSKFLWYSLRYNDLNKNYVKNLLFEIRTNPEFCDTEAYALVKKHSMNLMKILNNGIEEGIFRSDIDMRLMRDIIYGTIDFEAIGCIGEHETEESSEDFNDIISLILRMLEIRETTPASDKKENIICAAEDIFSRHGFLKAKVSEIAKIANVAEGSIYNLFVNKDDLLFSIADKHLKLNLKILPGIFHVESFHQKLMAFIIFHFTSLLNNQKFFKIYVIDTLLNKKFYKSKALEAHKKYLKIMEDIIEEGKAAGQFHSDVNPRVFRNVFMGAFTHMSLRWIIFENRRFDKLEEINSLCRLLLSSVSISEESDIFLLLNPQ